MWLSIDFFPGPLSTDSTLNNTSKWQLRYGLLSRHGERFAAPSLEGGSLESLLLGVEEVGNTMLYAHRRRNHGRPHDRHGPWYPPTQQEATGRLVAVVELCMRTPDGNLISSIKGPTLRYARSMSLSVGQAI